MKKNPHYQTSENFCFVLTNGWEMYTKGINNPTKIRTQNGELIEYEWTYNSSGFPVSFSQKGGSDDLMLFEYNQ